MKNDSNINVRKAAISKIDEKTLVSIAENDEYEICLKRRIEPETWHSNISKNAKIHAIKKLSDKKLLKNLLKKNYESKVQEYIQNRLKELE